MEKQELWSARVREWQASGQGFADFCRGKGFTPGGLRYWVKRLGASAERPPKAPEGVSKPVRIARVVRARGGARTTPAARSLAEHVVVEVGSMRVLVPVDLDPARLEAVLVAIGRASTRGAA